MIRFQDQYTALSKYSTNLEIESLDQTVNPAALAVNKFIILFHVDRY
jgi:hypothetical protein